MSKPSSKRIAELAGVSQATVSRILNQTGNVSDKKLRSVIAAAEVLGYDISNIRHERQTKNIAFVVSKARSSNAASFFMNPFYSLVFKGVEAEASKLSYNIVFTGIDEDEVISGRLPPVIQAKKVDGILAVGHMPPPVIAAFESPALPVVCIDNYAGSTPSVVTDNVGGMRRLIKHILERTESDIVFFCGPTSHYSFSERLAGYKCALGEAGIPWDPANIYFTSDATDQPGYDLAESVLDNRMPRAIICGNDDIAIGVLRWLNQKGIKVPDRVLVSGFDDISLSAQVFPTLTTVHVHKEYMGFLGVSKLVRLIDGVSADPEVSLISTKLVVRDSTVRNPS